MRNIRTILFGSSLALVLACALLMGVSKAQPPAAALENSVDRKPVLVELFTSEGCSSCPPADLLLQKLVAQQPVAGAEIIALEEHVDYWNHIGWVDPYSSSQWTERQQDYAAFFKNDPYTPQAVVDGHKDFVGNNSHDASSAIEKAARKVKTEIAIAVAQTDSNSSQLHVSVGKLSNESAGDAAEIWLAVTEDGLRSSVSRGENAGRVLPHIATLRSLHKIGVADANGTPASFSGDPIVKFDSHWNVAKLHVIVFVQNKKSREIIGVASRPIDSKTTA